MPLSNTPKLPGIFTSWRRQIEKPAGIILSAEINLTFSCIWIIRGLQTSASPAAVAPMMTQRLKGKTEAEARAVFAQFIDLLTGCSDLQKDTTLGDLSIFSGVREYPARVKCATLIWHTLQAALDGQEGTVETE